MPHGSLHRWMPWMPWLLAVVASFALPRSFLEAAAGGRALLRQLPLLIPLAADAIGSCKDCCVEDFCRCSRCECWQILRSLGYRTPLDASEALKQGLGPPCLRGIQWRSRSWKFGPQRSRGWGFSLRNHWRQRLFCLHIKV
eukprot:s40_g15.t3